MAVVHPRIDAPMRGFRSYGPVSLETLNSRVNVFAFGRHHRALTIKSIAVRTWTPATGDRTRAAGTPAPLNSVASDETNSNRLNSVPIDVDLVPSRNAACGRPLRIPFASMNRPPDGIIGPVDLEADYGTVRDTPPSNPCALSVAEAGVSRLPVPSFQH